MSRKREGAVKKGGRGQKALMMQVFINALRDVRGQKPLYNSAVKKKKAEGGERLFMWAAWTFEDGNRRV